MAGSASEPTISASRRAQLKRDLKAGRQPIHELLLQPPDYLQTAKVFDLLLAVPKYGRVKVNKILSQCRISPSKTLGGASPNASVGAGGAAASPLRTAAGRTVVQSVRHHRPVRGRQGDADPGSARTGPGPSSSRVSATTRAPRPVESDGSTTTPQCRRVRPPRPGRGVRRARHLLGSPLMGRCAPSSSRRLSAGQPVVLEIEVQGARQVARRSPMPWRSSCPAVHRSAARSADRPGHR